MFFYDDSKDQFGVIKEFEIQLNCNTVWSIFLAF